MKPVLYILSVPVQVGKTTRLAEWVHGQTTRGQHIGGFLMPDDETGRRSLLCLGTDRQAIPMEDPESGDVVIGRFKFQSTAFAQGLRALQTALSTGCDWIVVDELGPLEVRRGQGFEPGFRNWLSQWKSHPKPPKLLLVIRDFLLQEAMDCYDLSDAQINQGPWFPDHLPEIRGLLLAGGKSKRMGSDKAKLPHPSGGTWFSHSMSQLGTYVPETVVSGLSSGGVPDATHWAGHGPLSGLLTVHEMYPETSLLVRGVDYPNLSDLALSKLQAAYLLTGRTVCFRQHAHLEPLVALYSPSDLVSMKETFMETGEDSMQRMLQQLDPIILPVHPEENLGLENHNRPTDWSQDVAMQSVQRIQHGLSDEEIEDCVVVEEPLEIRLLWHHGKEPQNQPLSITMRTPGRDAELVIGFLVSEGMVQSINDIVRLESLGAIVAENGVAGAGILCALRDDCQPKTVDLNRNFYMTSSCGVCGKSSIDAIAQTCKVPPARARWKRDWLHNLPNWLRAQQPAFASTGGIHAAAWFTPHSGLVQVCEDVGRHNAMDKLVGWAAMEDRLPMADNGVLLVSGRASFELVSKAAMAGVGTLAAVGAPSSLACSLAEEVGMTLIGFLRKDRMNVYSHPIRIESP